MTPDPAEQPPSPRIREESVETIIPLGQADLSLRLGEIIQTHPLIAFEKEGEPSKHITVVDALTQLNKQATTNMEAVLAEMKKLEKRVEEAETRAAEAEKAKAAAEKGSPMIIDDRFTAMSQLIEETEKNLEEYWNKKFTELKEKMVTDWAEKERELTERRNEYIAEILGKFTENWEMRTLWDTVTALGKPEANSEWRAATQQEILRQRQELGTMGDCCKDVQGELAAIKQTQGELKRDISLLGSIEKERQSKKPEFPILSRHGVYQPSPLNVAPIANFPTYPPVTKTPQRPLPQQSLHSHGTTVAPTPVHFTPQPQPQRSPSPASTSSTGRAG